MNKLPLSPVQRRARIVIIVGYITFCIVLVIVALNGKDCPTDEQVYDTPNGGYGACSQCR